MALWARWLPVALALLGVSLAGADPQYDGQPARWLSDEVRAHPLATQMRSDYVTDRSRWGQVRVDGTMDWQGQGDPELARAVATQVEAYHRRWLARDEAALAELLHPDLLRVRNGTVTRGRSAALTQIAGCANFGCSLTPHIQVLTGWLPFRRDAHGYVVTCCVQV